jgi:hypothetical protein
MPPRVLLGRVCPQRGRFSLPVQKEQLVVADVVTNVTVGGVESEGVA